MQWIEEKIIWSPRLPKQWLAQCYHQDAAGLLEDEIADEIGTILYLRCRDILYIHDANCQHWRCPRCEATNGKGAEMVLMGDRRKDARDNQYACPNCNLSLTWGEFSASHKRKQLNPGGAVPAFEYFITHWPLCHNAAEKFSQIDRVVHAFHYSLKAKPDTPTRAAGVNLIEGSLPDVMDFLGDLSAGKDDPTTQLYHQEAARMRDLWGNWQGERDADA